MVQPAADGYEYLVTEERYVLYEDGRREIQHRRRESWRAADGWAWARQTGSDQSSFIFAPAQDWELIRKADPDGAGAARALKEVVGKVPAGELATAEFGFIYSLLRAETLPAGALPTSYRRAFVEALTRHQTITVTNNRLDPHGRRSVRIDLVPAGRPESIQSLFLDRRHYQFLAYSARDQATNDQGSDIAVTRRHETRIPDELLTKLGNHRTEKLQEG